MKIGMTVQYVATKKIQRGTMHPYIILVFEGSTPSLTMDEMKAILANWGRTKGLLAIEVYKGSLPEDRAVMEEDHVLLDVLDLILDDSAKKAAYAEKLELALQMIYRTSEQMAKLQSLSPNAKILLNVIRRQSSRVIS